MKPRTKYLFGLGIKLACFLPRPVTAGIAKVIATAQFLRAKKERLVVKKNLSYSGAAATSQNIYKVFINYGLKFVDTFRSFNLDHQHLNAFIDFKSKDNLNKALKFNRGLILIGAHLGNWDLAGTYLASLGFPVTAVVEEIPGLSEIYNAIRRKTGMEIVFLREKDKMHNALRNNRILGLLGDRDLTGRGVPVKFLSGEKLIPRGTASFALKHKSPICFGYLVFSDDKKNGKIYKAEVSEPLVPGNESLEELLQMITDRLSSYIRQFPTQWFIFFDEWLEPSNN